MPLRRIAFDSNVLIYLMEKREPYAPYVVEAVSLIERGPAVGVISPVVEMELLVRPLRVGDTSTQERIELFFRSTPNLLIRSVDRAIARRAARVRASTRLRAIDAIIVATAIEERCDAIIGNDAAMASQVTGIPYLYLEDYV